MRKILNAKYSLNFVVVKLFSDDKVSTVKVKQKNIKNNESIKPSMN